MASKLVVLNFVDSDRLPDVDFELENVDVSVPSKFISITLRVRKEGGTTLSKPAVIDDGPNGLFHFEWDPGDLSKGQHRAEVTFVDLNNKAETFPADEPLVFDVRGRV